MNADVIASAIKSAIALPDGLSYSISIGQKTTTVDY
jgi:hypothetical protein